MQTMRVAGYALSCLRAAGNYAARFGMLAGPVFWPRGARRGVVSQLTAVQTRIGGETPTTLRKW